MNIQKYDMFTLRRDKSSHISINSIKKPMDNIFYIRIFLIHCLRNTSNFINAIQTYSKDGMSFELLEVNMDNKNNLVYLSECWYDYKDKPTTPEIDKLLEEDNFIELCKMGFLDYIALTKENFIHLLLTWDKILEQLPPFALLYLDDKNWYDVLPFESQQAMEAFVVTHTKKEII